MTRLYVTFVCGLLYVFLTTLPAIFRGVYEETRNHWIETGIGATGASQTSAVTMDKQRHGTGKPGFRLCRSLPRLPLLCQILTRD